MPSFEWSYLLALADYLTQGRNGKGDKGAAEEAAKALRKEFKVRFHLSVIVKEEKGVLMRKRAGCAARYTYGSRTRRPPHVLTRSEQRRQVPPFVPFPSFSSFLLL
jgi:hypothetical protein